MISLVVVGKTWIYWPICRCIVSDESMRWESSCCTIFRKHRLSQACPFATNLRFYDFMTDRIQDIIAFITLEHPETSLLHYVDIMQISCHFEQRTNPYHLSLFKYCLTLSDKVLYLISCICQSLWPSVRGKSPAQQCSLHNLFAVRAFVVTVNLPCSSCYTSNNNFHLACNV